MALEIQGTEESSMGDQLEGTSQDEQRAHDVWKYYGGIGGSDKNTMLKIVIWLLGISAGIISVYATHQLHVLAAILLLLLGISVSILAAFTALLYGGYAARNWSIADRIARDYHWDQQQPDYDPFEGSKVHWTAVFPLWLARPCINRIAPVFWVFFAASLVSLTAHLVLLIEFCSR